MSIIDKSDEEIIKIAEPIWANLVRSSNIKDYGSFTKDLSSQMLYGANEVELGNNGLTMNLYRHCPKAVRHLAVLEEACMSRYYINRLAPRYLESF